MSLLGPTAWPYVLTVNVVLERLVKESNIYYECYKLPTGGATFRAAKTTANGNWFFGPAQTMVVGSNSITVSRLLLTERLNSNSQLEM